MPPLDHLRSVHFRLPWLYFILIVPDHAYQFTVLYGHLRFLSQKFIADPDGEIVGDHSISKEYFMPRIFTPFASFVRANSDMVPSSSFRKCTASFCSTSTIPVPSTRYPTAP
mgnify:CR=1 FL=1